MTGGMRETPRPPLSILGAGLPLGLAGVLATGWFGVFLLWCAARAAGGTPALGPATVIALAAILSEGSLDPLIGAPGSRPLFWLVAGAGAALLLAGAGLALWFLLFRWAPFGSPARSLAGRREYRDMRGRGAVRRAQQLRPSLPADHRAVRQQDVGIRLGRLGRELLFASEEDVVLVVAGPRSNKTSAEVVPAVLSAPGPVIATSNKVDLFTLTGSLRAQLGRVFVFDPQHIAGVTQTWWWNPLAGIRDMADAQHLVAHFSQTVGAGHERADPYFTRGAERLLGQLLVAAARGGRGRGQDYTLRDIRRWLATRSEEPVELLRTAGLVDVAEGLQGTIEAPADQRGGLYETALTAVGALESEAVARYVTPPASWLDPPQDAGDIEEFDPWRFIVGYRLNHYDGEPQPHDSLYLLTREGAGTGAPVVAALVDHLLRTTSEAATARGGRVDPPVRAVLDEAANICPIKNLPDLYSYFGSMSIQVMSFLQSYQQGVAIWGKAGMEKLWGAATVKLVGAGVHDPSFCEDISRLIGDHDVPTWSAQHGSRQRSMTESMRRDRILSAAKVAALPKTSAILITSGRRPGVIELLPWYREPDADQIGAHARTASEEVRQAAITQLGPDNPLAQLLQRQARQAVPRRGP